MSVTHFEILVEEASMEAALRAMLPSLLAGVSFAVYPHQCKEELLQRLPDRLRGYTAWLPETSRIVVVVDRDDDDCRVLKRRLEGIAASAGMAPPAVAPAGNWTAVNRLVIEELEAWYFGDWDAVRAVYPRVPATVPQRAGYRDPDAIAGGTWEAFERVLRASGYFRGGLRKIEAARTIAPNMDPSRNRSRSFQVFRDTLMGILPT